MCCVSTIIRMFRSYALVVGRSTRISVRFGRAIHEMVVARLIVVGIFPISHLGGGSIRIKYTDFVFAKQSGYVADDRGQPSLGVPGDYSRLLLIEDQAGARRKVRACKGNQKRPVTLDEGGNV